MAVLTAFHCFSAICVLFSVSYLCKSHNIHFPVVHVCDISMIGNTGITVYKNSKLR